MTDAIFWDAHEELELILEKQPSYEEVTDFLNSKFKENCYDRKLCYPSIEERENQVATI